MDFTKIARRETTMSALLEGRERIETDELIEKFSGIITINGFDFLRDNTGKKFAVVTFEEDDKVFYFGGTILTKICDSWVGEDIATDGDGDVERLSEELSKTPVKVEISKGKTKQGRDLTMVKVL